MLNIPRSSAGNFETTRELDESEATPERRHAAFSPGIRKVPTDST